MTAQGFQKLNEDEIHIEVEDKLPMGKNYINVVLRNQKNENFNYSLDNSIIKYVREMRHDVKIFIIHI
jgi:hypothetical protein